MVPAAPNSPAINPPRPMRRHIGQSFGGFNDQRPSDGDVGSRMKPEESTTRRMRAVGNCDRTVDNGARAAWAEKAMDKRTLEQLEAALSAVSRGLSPRVEDLATKSTEGVLTPNEREEYAEIPGARRDATAHREPRARVMRIGAPWSSTPRATILPSVAVNSASARGWHAARKGTVPP